jgi:LysM repeat protein
MNQPATPKSRYGQERTCPHCGARVAQRARTCFSCGASLENGPRRRFRMPWADITLFTVIGAMVVLWWLRPPGSPGRPRLALLSTATRAAATGQDAGSAGSDTNGAAAFTSPGSPGAEGGTPAPSGAQPVPNSPAATSASGTPQPSETPAGTRTPTPTPIIYKVKNGDTLLVIAEHFSTTVKAIIDANGLSSDGFIQLGQELQIPPPGQGGPSPQSGQSKPTATPTGGTLIYRVSEGDTIADIAERFGSTIDWILQANKLKESDYLSIGQSLLIPLSNSTPQPTGTATPGPASPTPTSGPHFQAPVLVGPVEGMAIA